MFTNVYLHILISRVMLVDGRGRSGEQSGERQRKMLKRCEK
jgi:hypothetical protein